MFTDELVPCQTNEQIIYFNGVIKESPADTRVKPAHDNNACMKAEPEEEPPVPPAGGGPHVAQGPNVMYGKKIFVVF